MVSRKVVIRKPQWTASRTILSQPVVPGGAVHQADDHDQDRQVQVDGHAGPPAGSGAFVSRNAGPARAS